MADEHTLAGASRSVQWTAIVSGETGYADESRSLIAAMNSIGLEVAIDEIAPNFTTESLATRPTIREASGVDIHVIHHPWPILPSNAAGPPTIWRITFETDRMPPAILEQALRASYLWVPSKFNRRVFAECGISRSRVAVIPPPIASNTFCPASGSAPSRSAHFTFLSVFRWQRRKGWDILLRAFLAEFAGDENVKLILKADPFDLQDPERPQRELKELVRAVKPKNRSGHPGIELETAVLSQAELVELYRSADAFVLPSRGEGWGRPLIEAMAIGLPTIATGWSGNLDFMSDENSYLVDYRLVDVDETAAREWPLFRGHRWAQPSVEHLRSILREVYEDRQRAKAVGAFASDDVRERFSYASVASRISQELERIG